VLGSLEPVFYVMTRSYSQPEAELGKLDFHALAIVELIICWNVSDFKWSVMVTNRKILF
jgi:hypothetical protein